VEFLYVIHFEAYLTLKRPLVEAWRLMSAKKVVPLGDSVVPAIGSTIAIAGTPYRCTGIQVSDGGTSYGSRCDFAVELWPANPTQKLHWPANGRSAVCHPLNAGETFSMVCLRLKNAGFELNAQNPHDKSSFRVVPVSK